MELEYNNYLDNIDNNIYYFFDRNNEEKTFNINFLY